MASVLVPLPDRDFDVTEVAVPWHVLREAGHDVVFTTETGATPACDPLLLTGVIFGQLGAEPEPCRLYHVLEDDPAFRSPVPWTDLKAEAFDAMLVPGGHAQGMKQLLDSPDVQRLIAEAFALQRPFAAICHGVLAVARAKDPGTGRSVIASYRTTCLPRYMERTAWLLTAWKLGRYYRTYDDYVQDEVCAALDDPAAQFERGPLHLVSRGTADDDGPAFVVEDRHYVSGRWPGDAYKLGRSLAARLA